MGVLANSRAFGAVGAEVERAVEARLLADPDTLPLHGDFGENRAADRAVRADGFLDLNLAAAGAGRLRLLDARAGHGGSRGQAADGEAGIPQERPAIDGRVCQLIDGR